MRSLKDIRKMQYEYHYEHELCQFFRDWKRAPYSYFRGIMWMEMSAFVVYILQRTRITPNALSVAYCLSGLVGGILLAIPLKATILIAVFVFFFKAIFDWCDGLLARVTRRFSLAGDILDCYGAILGAMGLEIGLGFYVAHRSGMDLYYYLIPLIPLFFFGKLHSFAFHIFYKNYITTGKLRELFGKQAQLHAAAATGGRPEKVLSGAFERIRNFTNNFLDHRSRTIDLICLLLLVEQFTSVFVTWIVFLGFVIKEFLLFAASFYVVVLRGWAEKELENKLKEISGAFPREADKSGVEIPVSPEG